MAERSSELNYTNGSNTRLTKTGFDDDDNLLEIRSADEEAADVAPNDAEQIREQIEETRSQMSETIDEIGRAHV